MTDKTCYEIKHNLAIWTHKDQITYTPCSANQQLSYGTTEHIIDTTKIWQGSKHSEIGKDNAKNLPTKGCEVCYKAEAQGENSRRVAVQSLYQDFLEIDQTNLNQLISLDISVDNLCNLRCLICGPNNSTAWIPDYQKLFPSIDISHLKFRRNEQINVDESVINGNIKRVHFHGGGEPLLSDYHLKFLKLLKKHKKLSDVYVFYNTNGTVKVSDEILDIWSECRLVELYFSIDDIGPRLEYQRPGISWIELQDNLLWYREHMPSNHMFKINCVYSYLNFYYLNDLYRWYQKFFIMNRLGDPIEFILQKVTENSQYDLRLQELTLVQYETIKNKFNSSAVLTNLLSNIKISEHVNHKSFLQTIHKFDSIKTKKYFESHNEWMNLLFGENHYV